MQRIYEVPAITEDYVKFVLGGIGKILFVPENASIKPISDLKDDQIGIYGEAVIDTMQPLQSEASVVNINTPKDNGWTSNTFHPSPKLPKDVTHENVEQMLDLLGVSGYHILASRARIKSEFDKLSGDLANAGVNKGVEPPQELIDALVRNCPIPCEHFGPYHPEYFHANANDITSIEEETDEEQKQGFSSAEMFDMWQNKYSENLAICGSWDKLNFEKLDVDWVTAHGRLEGTAFSFSAVKSQLEEKRESVVREYTTAMKEAVRKEPKAFAKLASGTKYRIRCPVKSPNTEEGISTIQPVNTIMELYKGALAALYPLWLLCCEVKAFVESEDGTTHETSSRNKENSATSKVGKSRKGSVELCWNIKKLRRTQIKIAEKYDMQPNRVTDVARTSLIFETIGDLLVGLNFLLAKYGTRIPILKNRFSGYPGDNKDRFPSGYVDILLNIWIGNEKSGHLCEMQLHLKSIYEVKMDGGYNAHKWLRRLLQPDDIYNGKRNEKGQKDGEGKMVYGSGDIYDGHWQKDTRHGHGRYTWVNGDEYVGDWSFGKKNGKGRIVYQNGDIYDGCWRDGQKNGSGAYRLVSGDTFWGKWLDGKRVDDLSFENAAATTITTASAADQGQ